MYYVRLLFKFSDQSLSTAYRFLVKGPCILYQSSRCHKANDSDFIKYFPRASTQVLAHKANIMSSSTCYWPEAWLDVMWDLHRKEPKHLWFIFHALDGRGGGGRALISLLQLQYFTPRWIPNASPKQASCTVKCGTPSDVNATEC